MPAQNSNRVHSPLSSQVSSEVNSQVSSHGNRAGAAQPVPANARQPQAGVSSRFRALLRWRSWHRWLGLWLGALLLLICLSGSVLLFKNQLLQWQYPQLKIPLVTDSALQGRVLDMLDQSQYGFARLPHAQRPWLELSRHDGTLEYWSVPSVATEPPQLLLSRAPYSDAIDWCYQLHMYLFVKPWEHQLVGVVGLLAVLVLLSGLLTQWPRRWRMLKLPLPATLSGWFSRRHGRPQADSPVKRPLPAMQLYRQWHYVLGVCTLPLLLNVILTGSAMSYNPQVQWLLSVVFDEAPVKAAVLPPTAPTAPGSSQPAAVSTTASAAVLTQAESVRSSQWGLWLYNARMALPEAELRLASFAKSAGDAVQFRAQLPEEWHPNGRTIIRIDSKSGAVLLLKKATELPRGFQISQLIYPLHVAAVGGPVYLWLLFVSGLLPLLLWLLGYGWRRARLRQERQQARLLQEKTNAGR